MEEYKIQIDSRNEVMIKQGKYYNNIYNKHLKVYSQVGADNIRNNVSSTFREALLQINDDSKNNNMLLVGKVQSGKTSNLELFTALALDNGFNLVVIYGGYDSTLLNQTTNRFKNTFDIPSETDYSDDSPVIFSSDDSGQIINVDNEIIEDLLEANKPIFLISMKRPPAMKKINALLNRIDKSKLRALVIDDEGDQASLNTSKNKESDFSPTYAEIVSLKNHLSNPLYLSVTATPQANIFLNEYSELRPDSIRLIEPGGGYCGAECYHLYDDETVQVISDEDHEDLDNGVLPLSIKSAINYFFVASAIMKKRRKKSSDMIIHTHRENIYQNAIYNLVYSYIEDFRNFIEHNDNDCIDAKMLELEECYKNYIPASIWAELPFGDLKSDINEVVCRTYIILENTVGKTTQANKGLRKHKIYIGGDLLQRGVTFPNLVTTYFTRWAKDGGNMDTNLQRARWFGYREKYIDICKLFTTKDIAREFTNLAEIETDLWEQFYLIQQGDMEIDEVLIQSDITKQKPTRKQVVDYNKVSFKSKWIKQRVGVFDSLQIRHNNEIVDNLVSTLQLQETTIGRNDNKTSAKYAVVKRESIANLLKQIQTVFDLEPFELKPLNNLLSGSDEIPLIFMSGFDGNGRKRSFYQDNKIYALHQGADSKDKDKIVYKGDSFVVVSPDRVNIQIHKVIPKRKSATGSEELMGFMQYMFAVYVPKGKTYFIKG
jgi:hypothetical protein